MPPIGLRSWPHWSASSPRAFRRYFKTISEEHFAIDPEKIEAEKKFDSIFVLRTNTDLNPLEAMLCYKQLWTVEQTFRTAKHLFSTRPIFHKLDETIRGHVFCSFFALVRKSELEERIQVSVAPAPGRKTLHRSLGAAPGCQPSPAGHRRRAALCLP
jgi:hypothetical protein